jgi:hypothetical protein
MMPPQPMQLVGHEHEIIDPIHSHFYLHGQYLWFRARHSDTDYHENDSELESDESDEDSE